MSVGIYNFAGLYKMKIMQNSQNRTKDYRFSIVVPVYNEQENMAALENRLSNFLSHSIYPACVIFVNDGSKDESGRYIREICSRHKDFFYLDFMQNAGLSAAIKSCESTSRAAPKPAICLPLCGVMQMNRKSPSRVMGSVSGKRAR